MKHPTFQMDVPDQKLRTGYEYYLAEKVAAAEKAAGISAVPRPTTRLRDDVIEIITLLQQERPEITPTINLIGYAIQIAIEERK